MFRKVLNIVLIYLLLSSNINVSYCDNIDDCIVNNVIRYKAFFSTDRHAIDGIKVSYLKFMDMKRYMKY